MKKSWIGVWAVTFKLGTKLLKSGKALKVLLAGGSLAAYSAIFSWQFALLILFAIGIHESGHVWAMRRCGLKTKGFYFLPFLGGVAVGTEAVKTQRDNVVIILMGPLWGCLSALPCVAMYAFTGNPFWAAASGWIAMINLFNLLPVHPLDGGRLLTSVARSINGPLGLICMAGGACMALGMFVMMGIGLFAVLTVLGIIEAMVEWQGSRNGPKHAKFAYHLRELGLPGQVLESCEDYRSGVVGQVSLMVLNEANSEMEVITCPINLPPEEPVKTAVPLGKKEVITSAMMYALLVIMLLAIVISMAHEPGAKVALDLLTG